MFSNRLCLSFNYVHLRRSAVSIYFNKYHRNFNIKHNLSLASNFQSNLLDSSKYSRLLKQSSCVPVRQFNTSVQEALGEVRILRGVRRDFQDEITVPSPFQCGSYIFNLTRVLNQDSIKAIFDFTSGFEQAFNVYTQLLRERNPNDVDRDWLQPTAQEDTKEIINRLPGNVWVVVENPGFLVPFCIGYRVSRDEGGSSVDTAIFLPSALMGSDKNLLWHLIFTRKFGDGVVDSWSIKYVAVYPSVPSLN